MPGSRQFCSMLQNLYMHHVKRQKETHRVQHYRGVEYCVQVLFTEIDMFKYTETSYNPVSYCSYLERNQ
jgi:hypothetical protein